MAKINIPLNFAVFLSGAVLIIYIFFRTKDSTHRLEEVLREIEKLHEKNLILRKGREDLTDTVIRIFKNRKLINF